MKRLVKEGTTTRRLVKGSKQEMWKVECDATIDFTDFSEDEIYELASATIWIAIQGRARVLFTSQPEAYEYLTQVIGKDVYEAAIKRVYRTASPEETLMKATGCTFEMAQQMIEQLKKQNG